MPKLGSLLNEYGTSLRSIREQLKNLGGAMLTETTDTPDIPSVPTTKFYTAQEAKDNFGFDLPSPDYMLKMQPDKYAKDGFKIWLISPKDYQVGEDQTVTTPDGLSMANESDLEQHLSQVQAMSPVDYTETDPALIDQGVAARKVGTDEYVAIRKAFGNVFPQTDIDDARLEIQNDPVGSLDKFRVAGRTPETENLLRKLSGNTLTDQQLDEIFGIQPTRGGGSSSWDRGGGSTAWDVPLDPNYIPTFQEYRDQYFKDKGWSMDMPASTASESDYARQSNELTAHLDEADKAYQGKYGALSQSQWSGIAGMAGFPTVSKALNPNKPKIEWYDPLFDIGNIVGMAELGPLSGLARVAIGTGTGALFLTGLAGNAAQNFGNMSPTEKATNIAFIVLTAAGTALGIKGLAGNPALKAAAKDQIVNVSGTLKKVYAEEGGFAKLGKGEPAKPIKTTLLDLVSPNRTSEGPDMAPGTSVQPGLQGMGIEPQSQMFPEAGGGQKQTLIDVGKIKSQQAAKPLEGQPSLPETPTPEQTKEIVQQNRTVRKNNEITPGQFQKTLETILSDYKEEISLKVTPERKQYLDQAIPAIEEALTHPQDYYHTLKKANPDFYETVIDTAKENGIVPSEFKRPLNKVELAELKRIAKLYDTADAEVWTTANHAPVGLPKDIVKQVSDAFKKGDIRTLERLASEHREALGYYIDNLLDQIENPWMHSIDLPTTPELAKNTDWVPDITNVDKHVEAKYGGLPDIKGESEWAGKVDELEATPADLDQYLSTLKTTELKTEIKLIEATIGDMGGDLIETYRYESIEEGLFIEKYMDSILEITEKYRKQLKMPKAVNLDQGLLTDQAANKVIDNTLEIPIDEINIDPQRFQFKGNVDTKTGVTSKFQDATWNPKLANITYGWQDKNGKIWIVNGHHRLELAKRSGAKTIRMDIDKEINGITEKEARAMGAMKNISEDQGTPVDVAKFLKDSGKDINYLKEFGIPVNGRLASRGVALSQLDDSLFKKVINGTLDEDSAVAIGAGLPGDLVNQREVFKLIANKDLSSRELTALIKEAKYAGTTKVNQMTLFGETVEEKSLLLSRAKLRSFIEEELARDRRLFSFVTGKGRPEALSKGGTQVDVTKGTELAQQSATAQAIFESKVNAVGPIDDIMNESATRIVQGGDFNGIKRETLDRIREKIASGKFGIDERNPPARYVQGSGAQSIPSGGNQETAAKIDKAVSDISEGISTRNPEKIKAGGETLKGIDSPAISKAGDTVVKNADELAKSVDTVKPEAVKQIEQTLLLPPGEPPLKQITAGDYRGRPPQNPPTKIAGYEPEPMKGDIYNQAKAGELPQPIPEGERSTITRQLRDTQRQISNNVEMVRDRIKYQRTPDSIFTRIQMTNARKLLKEADALAVKLEKGNIVSREEINSLNAKLEKVQQQAKQALQEEADYFTAKASSVADYEKYLKERQARVKAQLVGYINDNMPNDVKGKMLEDVKNIKNEKDLNDAIFKVEVWTEKSTQGVLRQEIIDELADATVTIENNITKGKYTVEIQDKLDQIKVLNGLGKKSSQVPIPDDIKPFIGIKRNDALDKVVENINLSDSGMITVEECARRNELLMMADIKNMTSDELEYVLANIQNIKKTGKTLRVQKIEAFTAKMNNIKLDVVDTVTGGKGLKTGTGVLANKELQPKTNFVTNTADKLFNSNYAIEDLFDKLSKFSRTTMQKASKLSEWGKLIARTRTAEDTAKQIVFNEINAKMKEIFGLKSGRQIRDLFGKMQNEEINLGKFKTITNTGVEWVEVKFTKGQLIKKYQELLDPTLDKTFDEGMHWSYELKTAVLDSLSPQEKAWADYQMDFYQKYWESIDKVYSEKYGAHLGRNPFYSPISREGFQLEAEDILVYKDLQNYASALNGSLKARMLNVHPLKFSDANLTFINHVNQMEHFKAWSEPMQELRTVFSNPEVRSAIHQYHGANILNQIDNTLNDLARGGVDLANTIRFMDTLRANFSRAVIGLKPVLALQQIPSSWAYMTEMPFEAYLAGVADFFKHPVENYKWMMEKVPYIKARYSVGYERDIAYSKGRDAFSQAAGITNFKDQAYFLMNQGDKSAVLTGWWAKYKEGLKKGWSEAKAIDEANLATDRTQNTSSLDTLSSWQRGGSFMKLLTMFQNQPNKYFRIVANNARNLQYGRVNRATAIKNLLIAGVILPGIFQLISDGFRYKQDRQIQATVLSPVNSLLVVGNAAKFLESQLQGGWGNIEYQLSPIEASIRDIGAAIAKGVAIGNKVKDPYVDITSEDVISFIELLAKGTGELLGYPTPYLIQVEKAIRKGQPLNLLFTEWSLRETEKDLPGKMKDLTEKLGQPLEDLGKFPVDKLPPVQDTKKTYSEFKGLITKTLPSDITVKNGFTPRDEEMAKTVISEDTLHTLTNKKLYEIIDDIENDPTLNHTINQYWQDYQDRLKITSLDQLNEWDKVHPRYALGNVSLRELEIMRKYENASPAEKVKLKEMYPMLSTNPQEEWLKKNPKDNARLAVVGQANVLTQAAYNEAQRMVKELDYPESTYKDYLPPSDVATASFEYHDAVSKFKASSPEAQIVGAKNPALFEWMGLQPVDTPLQSLEINVKNRALNDQYAGYADDKSTWWSPSISDKKDPNYQNGREYARKQFRLTDEGKKWSEDQNRIEAYNKGTPDSPTPETQVKEWVEVSKLSDGPEANDAKWHLYMAEHPETYQWAIKNELTKDDGGIPDNDPLLGKGRNSEQWNLNVIKIRAQDEYIQKDKEYGELKDDDSRKAFLKENSNYNDDRRRVKAYSDGADEPIVKQYVDYGKIVDQYSASSPEAKLYRVDNQTFNAWGTNTDLRDKEAWQPIDPKDIPVLRINAKYRTQDEEYDAIKNPDDRIQKQQRETFLSLPQNKDYAADRIRRDGYQLGLQDSTVNSTWLQYNQLPDTGYWRERFRKENPNLDREVNTAKMAKGQQPWTLLEPEKIPSKRYDEITQQYQPLFDRYEKLTGTDTEKALVRKQIFATNPTFQKAWYEREAYKELFPESMIQNYVEYNLVPDKGYANERYLKEHPDFYQMLRVKHEMKDDYSQKDKKTGLSYFDKVPSSQVEMLTAIYDKLPTSGKQREAYRKEHPDLDKWLMMVRGLQPLGTVKTRTTESEFIESFVSKQQQVEKLKQLIKR